jgi:hypothetical protein
VREAFAKGIASGRPRLYAIIVTETGDHADPLLAIVTPWDILTAM